MNKTLKNLVLAAPLATVAVTLVPSAAMAAEPSPHPALVSVAKMPSPVGPGDFTDVLPGPVDPTDPTDPEVTPEPVDPTGPGDLTANPGCPTHGGSCGSDDDGDPGDPGEFDVPTRVDAGAAPTPSGEGGLQLEWLAAGGALVTAAGLAAGWRRRVS